MRRIVLLCLAVALCALPSMAQVNVTFIANTAGVPDTLHPWSFVQIRGYTSDDTAALTWTMASPARMVSLGGDYWMFTRTFMPGSRILFKFFTNATPMLTPEKEHLGWEADVNTATFNRELNVGNNDTTLPIMYVDGFRYLAGQYEKPFADGDTGTFAVVLRVNMQGWTGFNPATMKVGIRGSNDQDWGQTGELSWGQSVILTQEQPHANSGSQQYPAGNFYKAVIHVPVQYAGKGLQYKLVIHNASALPNEDWGSLVFNPASNSALPLPVSGDTTYHWFWFENQRPVTLLPEAPQLMAPLNFAPAVPLSMRFQWLPVANAAMYTLQVASDSLFNMIVTTAMDTAAGHMVTGLMPSTRYYWRVCAQSGNGNGPYSAVWTFTTTSSMNAEIRSAGVKGAWSSSATWVGGVVPGTTDNAVIVEGDSVWIDRSVLVTNLTVNPTAVLLFNNTTAVTVALMGNLVISPGGVFKVVARLSTTPEILHSMIVYGNLTNYGIFDLRAGSSGSTLVVCNTTFAGNANSVVTMGAYSSSNNEFNGITIAKNPPARVLLASDVVSAGGSSTQPTANPFWIFSSGIVQTNSFAMIHLYTSDVISGASSASYVIGAVGRGISNSAIADRPFPVGDETGYHPLRLRNTTPGGTTGHYIRVQCMPGNANPGSAAFAGGIDKVAENRYYKISYHMGATGNASMTLDRFAPSYGLNDGVAEGNTNLRVALADTTRMLWTGDGPTFYPHTTSLATPPTFIYSDSTMTQTLNSGQSIYVALARATGTLENSLAPASNIHVTFSVNMGAYTRAGRFNPLRDTVFLRGSFNGWGQTKMYRTADSIYSVIIQHVPSVTAEYKFFITSPGDMNGGWETGLNRSIALGTVDIELPVDYFDRTQAVPIVQTFSVPSMLTLELDLRPAYYFKADSGYVPATDGYQGTGPMVTGPISGVFINGPLSGGNWVSWDSAAYAQPMRWMHDDGMNGDRVAGDSIWTWTWAYAAGDGRMLKCKFGVNGFDNEAMYGNDHEFALPNQALNTIKVIFGAINKYDGTVTDDGGPSRQNPGTYDDYILIVNNIPEVVRRGGVPDYTTGSFVSFPYSFDNAESDGNFSTYWSGSSTLNRSQSTDFMEGTSSLQAQWTMHASESYGGYIGLMRQSFGAGGGTQNIVNATAISLWVKNTVAASMTGNVVFRLKLFDPGPNYTSNQNDKEEWVFEQGGVYDGVNGWTQIIMPLVERGAGNPSNTGFSLPGWNGTLNDGKMNLDRICGFSIEWSVGGVPVGTFVGGTVLFDKMELMTTPTLDPPQLVNPRDGYVNVPANDVQFAWSPVLLASGYRMDVATDSLFMNIIQHASMPTTGYFMNNLSRGTTYWWRVQAYNAQATSPYSVVKFRTAAITLVDFPPQNTMVNAGEVVTLEWNAPNIQNLRVYFKFGTDTSWRTVASSIPAAMTKFNWTIPGAVGNSLQMQFADAADPTSFVLSPTYQLIAPHTSSSVWNVQYVDTSVRFWNVWALNDQVAFAYGEKKTGGAPVIMRTVNSGLSWHSVIGNLPGTTSISGLTAASGNEFWAGDFAANIYHTTDGGTTWNLQASLPGSFVNGLVFSGGALLAFCDPTTNRGPFPVLRSTDFGATWNTISVTPNADSTEYGILGSYAVNGSTSYFGTSKGKLFRSTDAGASWMLMGTPLFSEDGISFASPMQGVVLNTAVYNNVVRTTDGGASWSVVPVTNGVRRVQMGVDSMSYGHGIIVGNTGVIMTTEDAGMTWRQQHTGVLEAFMGVNFPRYGFGWVVSNNGTILNCNAPASVAVTFQVNMNEYIRQNLFHPATDTVYVFGQFNNWSWNPQFRMSNNGSNIYSVTVQLPLSTTFEYKFWISTPQGYSEGFEGQVGPIQPYGNRVFSTGTTDMTLPLVYFNNQMPSSNYRPWQFVRTFPDTSYRGPMGVQGLVVDHEGKIWIERYSATTTYFDSTTGSTLSLRQIDVFYPSGLQVPFSPLRWVNFGPTRAYLTGSARGLALDRNGNILLSSADTLMRINASTGAGMNMLVPRAGSTLTKAAADENGRIYVGHVLSGLPIWIIDGTTFTILGTVADSANGIARTLEVADGGKTVLDARYTLNSVVLRESNDGTPGTYTSIDTVLRGMAVESMVWHPVSKDLWASAGSGLNPPNMYPGLVTGYSSHTWYAFNQSEARLDSISWRGVLDPLNERPRAISFAPGGDTAYVAMFGSGNPCVQMFARTAAIQLQPTILSVNASPDAASAIIHTSVNPNGSPTTIYVKYGVDTLLSMSSGSINIGSGTSVQNVPLQLTNLSSNTRYFFQLVAWNALGTVYSGVQSFQTTTSSNQALYFAGIGRARVTDAAPVGPNSAPSAYQITGRAITVEAWVYTTGLPGQGNRVVFITRPILTSTNAQTKPLASYQLGIAGDYYEFLLSDGDTSHTPVVVRSTTMAALNQWVHVAGTYDGAAMKLYVNGALDNSTPWSLSIGAGTTGLYAGGVAGYGYYNGLIDEIRLWNIVRSQTDIQNSMNSVLTGGESGLAGYWPFDIVTTINTKTGVTPDLTASANHLFVQNSSLINTSHGRTVLIAPTVAGGPRTAYQGQLYTFYPTVTGSPVPSISLVSGPAGMTYDAQHGVQWQVPSMWPAGWCSYQLEAANSVGSSGVNTYYILVSAPLERRIHSTTEVALSVRNDGHVGYDSTNFSFHGLNGCYDGGLIVAKSATQTVRALYRNDFAPIAPMTSGVSPGPGFDQMYIARYSDALAPNPIGLVITQQTHSKSTDPDRKYVIAEFYVKNTTGSPISSAYLGLGMDFDVGVANNNMGGYDAANDLSYIYEVGGATNPYYYGIASLKGTSSGHTLMTGLPNFNETTDSSLYSIVNRSIEQTAAGDFRAYTFVGPYSINAGDSVQVMFALVAGTGLTDLQTSIQRARALINSGNQPLWSAVITLRDSNGAGGTKQLTLGQHPRGSDGLDGSLGELELPPLPPTGVMDARFLLPTNPVVGSMIDYRDTAKTARTWLMQFQPGGGGYPIRVTWDPLALGSGSFMLKDAITGTLISVDMKAQNSYTVTNSAITQLKIEYTAQTIVPVAYSSGWNMVSVPVTAASMAVGSLFSNVTSQAYSFTTEYTTVTSFVNGKGYWLKFGAPQTVNFTGAKVTSQVALSSGWSMIGVYDRTVAKTSLSTTPTGIITSQIFGFDVSGYVSVDSLKSGRGYWVKTSQAGQLGWSTLGAKQTAVDAVAEASAGWGTITISDAQGRSRVLYAAKRGAGTELFALPPVPPEGSFDIRYETGSYAENLQTARMISIQAAAYPITIRVVGTPVRLSDAFGGTVFNKLVKPGEQVELRNASLSLLKVSEVEIPKEFSLEQNYPNPFNPTTTIRFGLPQNEHVKIVVVNLLGQIVMTPIDREMEAGYHQVTLNAAGLSSNVYFYHIQAGKFSQTRKMVLMK